MFALNTSYEGFSHVLLEAAALGVPIVTTPSGGNTELLTHEDSALLVSSEASQELAAALCRILEDSQLAARLVTRAKEKVQALQGPDALVSLISSSVCQLSSSLTIRLSLRKEVAHGVVCRNMRR